MEAHAGLFEVVEDYLIDAVQWLRLGIEALGVTVVAFGIVVALVVMLRPLLHADRPDFTAVRLSFARYLALALEFQLGADILSTAIAPSWDQIGKLGAIAVIRTALNHFLSREMEAERAELHEAGRPAAGIPVDRS